MAHMHVTPSHACEWISASLPHPSSPAQVKYEAYAIWIAHVCYDDMIDMNNASNECRDKERKNEKIYKKTIASWENSEKGESLWSFFHVDVSMIVS